MFKILSLIPLVIVVMCAEAGAVAVVQKQYEYDFGNARGVQCSNEYVICDRYIRSAPVPSLAPIEIPVRVSGDVPPLPSSSSEADSAEDETTDSQASVKTEPAGKTIMFGFASAEVSDRQSLSLIADDLKGDSSVIGIKVKGFTCDLGSKRYNDRLAKRRAWAVASIAGKAGLKILDVSGQGKCCYVPGERRLSRRAEITVVRGVRQAAHVPNRFPGVVHANDGHNVEGNQAQGGR